MVVPKVRQLIEGLSLSSSGYDCTKDILKNKYGNESKIINAYCHELSPYQQYSMTLFQGLMTFIKNLQMCSPSRLWEN